MRSRRTCRTISPAGRAAGPSPGFPPQAGRSRRLRSARRGSPSPREAAGGGPALSAAGAPADVSWNVMFCHAGAAQCPPPAVPATQPPLRAGAPGLSSGFVIASPPDPSPLRSARRGGTLFRAYRARAWPRALRGGAVRAPDCARAREPAAGHTSPLHCPGPFFRAGAEPVGSGLRMPFPVSFCIHSITPRGDASPCAQFPCMRSRGGGRREAPDDREPAAGRGGPLPPMPWQAEAAAAMLHGGPALRTG